MKKILIICLTISLFSCTKDKIPSFHNFAKLSHQKVLKYLPISNFDSSSKVIFVNDRNDEFELNVDVNERENTQFYGEKSYDVHNIFFTYDSEINANFGMYISSNAYYIDENTSSIQVTFGFYPTLFVEGNFSSISGFDSNGNPLLLTQFEENLSILNKNFEDVYFTKTGDQNSPYSQIYFNSEFGIIGFSDENNNLWVFDRFVK